MHSHYDVLKLALDAPADVVRAAYRVFAARYHPDRAGPAELALMQRVNEAYRVLSDPALRAAHDAWIRAHRRRRAADAPRARAAMRHEGATAPDAGVPGERVTTDSTPGPANSALPALPDATMLVQRAQRRRAAAAYAAHVPRAR